MLKAAEPLNKLSYFIKDNKGIKEKIDETEGVIDKINELLGKIVGMNCITEICIRAKIYK